MQRSAPPSRYRRRLAAVGRVLIALIGLLLGTGALAGGADTLLLARQRGGEIVLQEWSTRALLRESALPSTLQTPLGSLWKLYVHAYALDQSLPDPGYQCSGHDTDEVYCCEAGEHIDRDQALVRSCGLYYAPVRLGIQPDAWRHYWQSRGAPAWLQELAQMQPQTQVPVAEVLATLRALPAQDALRTLLLDVLVHARDPKVLGTLGATLRAKTFSWHRHDAPNERLGGFAGWMVDGSVVWASAGGTSQSVLARYSAALTTALTVTSTQAMGECVDVKLFERYPIRAVTQANRSVQPGRLAGSYQLAFANDNDLAIESAGELFLEGSPGQWTLHARLSREDYVARVLDREASVVPAAAARALSVVIRSYLQQNAARQGECLSIADSSATQRVAPRPASPAARAIAAQTADLVLTAAGVGYHLDQPGPGRLSWQHAVAQANAGARFDQILTTVWPSASLGRWDRPIADCQPLTAAATWLQAQLPRWRPRLYAEPGYDETSAVQVCRLQSGRPYVDRARSRVYVRGLVSLQDRLDLSHEYLHLAFATHPNGQDEAYVEALARRLLLE